MNREFVGAKGPVMAQYVKVSMAFDVDELLG